jgi:hypothetical protein
VSIISILFLKCHRRFIIIAFDFYIIHRLISLHCEIKMMIDSKDFCDDLCICDLYEKECSLLMFFSLSLSLSLSLYCHFSGEIVMVIGNYLL